MPRGTRSRTAQMTERWQERGCLPMEEGKPMAEVSVIGSSKSTKSVSPKVKKKKKSIFQDSGKDKGSLNR